MVRGYLKFLELLKQILQKQEKVTSLQNALVKAITENSLESERPIGQKKLGFWNLILNEPAPDLYLIPDSLDFDKMTRRRSFFPEIYKVETKG